MRNLTKIFLVIKSVNGLFIKICNIIVDSNVDMYKICKEIMWIKEVILNKFLQVKTQISKHRMVTCRYYP